MVIGPADSRCARGRSFWEGKAAGILLRESRFAGFSGAARLLSVVDVRTLPLRANPHRQVSVFARPSDTTSVAEIFLSGEYGPIEQDIAEVLLLEPAVRAQRLLAELDTLLDGDLGDDSLARVLLAIDPKIEYILDPAKGIEESEQSRAHGWLITG
jgi:hypothetical protein